MTVEATYGVPTVAMHTDKFDTVVRQVAAHNGMPGLRQVFVPQPIMGKTAAQLRAYVDGADPITKRPVMQEVLDGLTRPFDAAELGPLEFDRSTPRLLPADTEDNLHRLFLDSEWTDKLPIVLPTEERVATMLAATHRRPDEVVGRMRPTHFREYWEYTVEKVAVNAVMAGARPEYFPVILALASTGVSARGSSSSSVAAMAVVNGPVRQEIGMNAGTGALGPYSHANATIGRAYGLLSQNLQGGSTVGLTYMGSMGNNYAYNSLTCAENEERSPWEPFHVQHGFRPTDSAVSVFSGCRSTAFSLGLRETYWREHVANMLRGMDPHGPRSHHRATVHRPRRLHQEGRAHRLALRDGSHARRRVLGLSARAELHLSAGDLRRRTVGEQAQGQARGDGAHLPARGHSHRGGGRRDERLLADHGLQLSGDGVGGRVALDSRRGASPPFRTFPHKGLRGRSPRSERNATGGRVNRFQKQAGVDKSDFPYDWVAVPFKAVWEQ